MTQQNSTQQASSWDTRAARYDEAIAITSGGNAQQALAIMGVTPGQKVLDVAAGPGYFSILAAQAGADVVAIDFSEGMVEYLRDKIQRLGVENLRVEVMDGQDLKLEDESFDIAYSSLGIMLFPDRAAGMREFCRVLKPGGRGAIVAFTAEGLGAMHLVIGALNKIMPDFVPTGMDPLFSLSNPDIFRAEMLAAGFSRANMFTSRIVQPFASPPALWSWAGDAPVFAAIFNDLTEDQKQAVGDAFVQQIRSEQGDGPYGTENEVSIAVGVK